MVSVTPSSKENANYIGIGFVNLLSFYLKSRQFDECLKKQSKTL